MRRKPFAVQRTASPLRVRDGPAGRQVIDGLRKHVRKPPAPRLSSSRVRAACRSGPFLFDKVMTPVRPLIKEMEIMRFLGLVRSAEGQGAPPPEMMEAMGRFIEASLENGSLVQTGGLAPGTAPDPKPQTGGRL